MCADRLIGCILAEDIKEGKKVLFEKGTLIEKATLEQLREVFKNGYGIKEVPY
jgi:hypothetical protein